MRVKDKVMSEEVLLFSAHEITFSEMEKVILEAGGVLTGEGHIGRISEDKTKHIFVWPEDECIFPGVDPLYGTYELPTQKLIQTKMGATPRYASMIEIGSTPGSGLLAVHFVLTCAKYWPCVAVVGAGKDDNLTDNVFSWEDMLQLQKEGRGFMKYGM
jgi:hypothetical protein